MIPGGPDIRSDTLNEAATVLRRRAVLVGVEHGDYAAKFVIDDATIIANLDTMSPAIRVVAGHLYERQDLLDNPTIPTLSEDAIRADERARLIHHLQGRTFQSVQRVLEDLQAHDWDLPA